MVQNRKYKNILKTQIIFVNQIKINTLSVSIYTFHSWGKCINLMRIWSCSTGLIKFRKQVWINCKAYICNCHINAKQTINNSLGNQNKL